jgi:hypothetical protein
MIRQTGVVSCGRRREEPQVSILDETSKAPDRTRHRHTGQWKLGDLHTMHTPGYKWWGIGSLELVPVNLRPHRLDQVSNLAVK